jgi:uncharacterized protein (DUF302 family)
MPGYYNCGSGDAPNAKEGLTMNGQYLRRTIVLFSTTLAAILVFLIFLQDTSNTAAREAVKVVSSPYSFEKTINNLKQAIVNNNFKVIRETKSENSHTIYFCNFSAANESIKADKRSGILLPCKLKVIQDKDKVFIATLDIESVRKLLGIRVTATCKQIKKSIDQIMEDSVI